MDTKSLKDRLFDLKKQLNEFIIKIEIERQESKDDEQVVLNELLVNKNILEEEINELELTLNNSKIKKVKLKNFVLEKNNKIMKFSIVPEILIDSDKGYISEECPLAKAILKAKAGESFEIKTPGGKLQYTLKKIL